MDHSAFKRNVARLYFDLQYTMLQDSSCSKLLKKLKTYVNEHRETAGIGEPDSLNRSLHFSCSARHDKKMKNLTGIIGVLRKVKCICNSFGARQPSCCCASCDTCQEKFLLYFVQHNIKALYRLIEQVGSKPDCMAT
jgi:hypothetical protein